MTPMAKEIDDARNGTADGAREAQEARASGMFATDLETLATEVAAVFLAFKQDCYRLCREQGFDRPLIVTVDGERYELWKSHDGPHAIPLTVRPVKVVERKA